MYTVCTTAVLVLVPGTYSRTAVLYCSLVHVGALGVYPVQSSTYIVLVPGTYSRTAVCSLVHVGALGVLGTFGKSQTYPGSQPSTDRSIIVASWLAGSTAYRPPLPSARFRKMPGPEVAGGKRPVTVVSGKIRVCTSRRYPRCDRHRSLEFSGRTFDSSLLWLRHICRTEIAYHLRKLAVFFLLSSLLRPILLFL
jgi:hypothetical protein